MPKGPLLKRRSPMQGSGTRSSSGISLKENQIRSVGGARILKSPVPLIDSHRIFNISGTCSSQSYVTECSSSAQGKPPFPL